MALLKGDSVYKLANIITRCKGSFPLVKKCIPRRSSENVVWDAEKNSSDGVSVFFVCPLYNCRRTVRLTSGRLYITKTGYGSTGCTNCSMCKNDVRVFLKGYGKVIKILQVRKKKGRKGVRKNE